MNPIMRLQITIYENNQLITKANRYTEEQFQNICEALSSYFPLYSYEEVRYVDEHDTFTLAYYKNNKQQPIPVKWLREEHEFGDRKHPKIKKLVGNRIPLTTWDNIWVLLEPVYE